MPRGHGQKSGRAEIEPKVSLSMGRKIVEISKENERFGWAGGLMIFAGSQKLRPPQVWGGKSCKFEKKIKDLGA